MQGIRCYNEKGQERWINRPGQIVPVGWYSETFEQFQQEQVAVFSSESGNPYDEGSLRKILVLVPKKS